MEPNWRRWSCCAIEQQGRNGSCCNQAVEGGANPEIRKSDNASKEPRLCEERPERLVCPVKGFGVDCEDELRPAWNGRSVNVNAKL